MILMMSVMSGGHDDWGMMMQSVVLNYEGVLGKG
jgi:hypothetical protein